MSKEIKNRLLAELRNEVRSLDCAIVVDLSALTGNESNALRRGLGASGVFARTMKSSFARQILTSTSADGAKTVSSGPTTLVWGGEDLVHLSREITKWSNDLSKIRILGGGVGSVALTAEDVERLSKSPGRVELLGMIAGLIGGPGGRVVGAIRGPGGRLVGSLSNVEDRESQSA